MLFAILAAAFAAGVIQSVTGFGAGIILMFVLPSLYVMTECAGIVGAVIIALTAMVTYTYREHINIKKIIIPALIYMAVSSAAIHMGKSVDQAFMKKLLGGFLILLSCYYLFFSKSAQKKALSPLMSLICIVISGICDGMFGIGGPLMVVYYMSSTNSVPEYLGTLQAFFMVTCIYNTVFRIFQGILNTSHIPSILIGICGILAGVAVGGKLVNILDENKTRKLTYIMIGFAGIVNILG